MGSQNQPSCNRLFGHISRWLFRRTGNSGIAWECCPFIKELSLYTSKRSSRYGLQPAPRLLYQACTGLGKVKLTRGPGGRGQAELSVCPCQACRLTDWMCISRWPLSTLHSLLHLPFACAAAQTLLANPPGLVPPGCSG